MFTRTIHEAGEKASATLGLNMLLRETHLTQKAKSLKELTHFLKVVKRNRILNKTKNSDIDVSSFVWSLITHPHYLGGSDQDPFLMSKSTVFSITNFII